MLDKIKIYNSYGDNMNKKFTVTILCIFFLFAIMIAGATGSNQNIEPGENDSAYYVESSNVVSKIAKICDTVCYYVVDIVLDGISSIFNKIIGQ